MITELLVCDYYILLLYAYTVYIYYMYIYIYIWYYIYVCVYMGDPINGGTSKRMVDNGKAKKMDDNWGVALWLRKPPYSLYSTGRHMFLVDFVVPILDDRLIFWAKLYDRTLLPNPGIMVKRNHPQMAASFRLVNYFNLPRFLPYVWREHLPCSMMNSMNFDEHIFPSSVVCP